MLSNLVSSRGDLFGRFLPLALVLRGLEEHVVHVEELWILPEELYHQGISGTLDMELCLGPEESHKSAAPEKLRITLAPWHSTAMEPYAPTT